MKSYCDFAASYAGYGGKSYISFSVPASENIVLYQTEMIAKNKIDSLLPLSVQRLNDDWKLSYEITSKIPLVKVLERKSLKYEEFESIIAQMGKLSIKLRDYLLDISSVIFDKSYIYCDPDDLSLYFIYFPVKTGGINTNSMKDFLQKLIFEDIRLLDESSGNLLKRLLDILKSENFSPEQLLKCVNLKQPEKQHYINQNGNEGYEADKAFNGNFYAVNNDQNPVKNVEAITKIKANQNENISAKPKSNITGLIYPVKSYLVAGAINIVFIGTFIGILISKTGTGNTTSTLLGLVLIVFAVNYFIFTRLFSENKKTIENGKTVKSVKIPEAKHFVDEVFEEDIILPKRAPVKGFNSCNIAWNDDVKCDNAGGAETDCEIKKEDSMSLCKDNITRINNSKIVQDRTIILGFATNVPFLQSHSCPSERINITKDSMLLGRLSESVDYTINNRAVGKIHAEIIKREDNYYIIDLNSVNGTYVNNERITCSTEVLLKNGDIITLANESYTFVL